MVGRAYSIHLQLQLLHDLYEKLSQHAWYGPVDKMSHLGYSFHAAKLLCKLIRGGSDKSIVNDCGLTCVTSLRCANHAGDMEDW